MTFFFAFHLTWGGKLDICKRIDLFFAIHLTLGGTRTALNCGYPPIQIPGHAPALLLVR